MRRARMMTYDLTADDDAVWGLGLGCNGKIEVFVEAVRPDAEPDVAALLQACIDDRRFAALATVIASPSERGRPGIGSRLFVPEEGRAAGSLGDAALDARVAALARRQIAAGTYNPGRSAFFARSFTAATSLTFTASNSASSPFSSFSNSSAISFMPCVGTPSASRADW